MENFSKGINNVARPNRLPEGAVRDMLNLVPSADGALVLRPHAKQVLACSDCRMVHAVGGRLVVVDAGQVLSFAGGGTPAVIGHVDPLSPVAGVLHNNQLYFSTAGRSLRTDGYTVRGWALPAPLFSVETIEGGGMAGRYRVAVTATVDGVESGSASQHIDVPAGRGVRVTSADPRALRVYISAADSATPYYQGPLVGGAQAYTAAYHHQEPLATDGLVAMPHCEAYRSYRGVIVGRAGRYLFFTEPLYPHLTDSVRGFLQYPADISVIAPVDGGLYVVADKTYFVQGVETSAPTQSVRLEVGAVAGTECILPGGEAYWMTPHGPVLADASGAKLVTRDSFSPQRAESGASGYLQANGNEVVVTSMRGVLSASALVSTDWAPNGDKP